MKKNIFMMAFGVAAMLMMTPCTSYANNSVSYSYQDDDDRGDKVELTEPEKYALKKPAKRAAGSGKSRTETSAEIQARQRARANFAEAIRAAVVSASKSVFLENNYFVEDEEESGEDVKYEFRSHNEGGGKTGELIKSVANEVIQNAPVVKKEHYYNRKRRRHTVYVCLEYDGEVKEMVEQVVKKIAKRVPKEDRQRIEENLDKFEFEIVKDLEKPNGDNNKESAEDNEE